MKQPGFAHAVALLAVLISLVAGSASAALLRPHPDFASKADFKQTCEAGGGKFSEGKYSTACDYPDGTIRHIVCDETGKNCTQHTVAVEQPTPGRFDDIVADDPGGVLVEETPTPTPTPTLEPTAEPTAESTVEPTAPPALEPTADSETITVATTVPQAEVTTRAASADAGSFELAVRACPAGYDPFEPDARPGRECRDAAGEVAFRLLGEEIDEQRSSGEEGDGVVRFDDLEPGAYRLIAEPTPGVAMAFIDECRSTRRDMDDLPFFPAAVAGPNGTLGVRLEAEEELACIWYMVPDAEAATVAVTLRWCPNTTVNSAACEPYGDGFGLTLSPVDGGEAFAETTDGEGRATFRVSAGTYALAEEDGWAWCFADSRAFDVDGYLVVGEGEAVDVTIYNCGDLP